ncbi:MAG: hypothetical protein GY866_11055, partial [Proteobacteria bacterium]|nr:hypothetical protein [Pseudomonadota bacterium]
MISNFFKVRSIKAKLILMILGIVVSIVLALTAVIAFTTANFWEKESKRQLFQNLDQSVYLLQNFLEVRESNLEIWRRNPLVETIFRDPALAEVFVSSLRAEFKIIKEKEPWLVHIFLVQGGEVVYDDSDGFVFSDGSNGDPNGIEVLKVLPAKGITVMNLRQFNPDEFLDIVLIKRPIVGKDSQVTNGFMVAVLDLDIVNKKLFGKTRIGKRGFMATVGQGFFGELKIGLPYRTGLEAGDFRETSQTWKSIDDIPDTFRSILIGKRRLKNRPLTVVGIVSLNDLREPVLSLLYLSCAFSVIALIIGITSAVFYATRLTGPIRQLIQKVQQISNGERGIDGQIKASEGTVLSNLSTTLSASSSTLEYQEHAQDELSFLN